MNTLMLFPENGLANSVIPPVFVGLSLSTFFAETLGWNFSGLIVPGYLAPILIVKPLSGLVIIVEALISYLILRILSDGCSRLKIWTSFFGQDAFFALFCISILVKSAMEGPLLPIIGVFIERHFQLSLDYHNELHSTGLIIVPLLANIFWRHGFRRNVFPVFTTVALTYAITKYILVPYTNFSVNRFELMYSKMATDFLESPRYYLILLIGTALASHNRYRFGWAYHGMLIPALLGIAWLTPFKVVTTFLESGFILLVATILTQHRLMKNITLEGPRKLLLLFSIGFFLKWILGFLMQIWIPGYPVTDLYGFAYILPALIAMEMWTKASYLRVTRVTLQTSFIAAIAGLALNTLFQFTSIGEFSLKTDSYAGNSGKYTAQKLELDEIKANFNSWLSSQLKDRLNYGINHVQLTIQQLNNLDKKVITPIIRHINRFSLLTADRLETIQTEAMKCGISIIRVQDEQTNREFIVFLETSSPKYQGIYIFRADYGQPYIIEIPNPLVELNTINAGLEFFHALNARALFISGTSRRKEYAEFDVTHSQFLQSLFQLFHQASQRETIETEPHVAIQIRGAAELPSSGEILISFGEPKTGEDMNVIEKNLLRDLASLDLESTVCQGTKEDMQFDIRSNAQFEYTSTFNMGEFATLWISSRLRQSYSFPDISPEFIEEIDGSHEQGSLFDWIEKFIHTRSSNDDPSDEWKALWDSVREELKLYYLSGNIIHLSRIAHQAEAMDYQFVDFIDTGRNARLILLRPEDTIRPALCFPYIPGKDSVITIEENTAMRNKIIDKFFITRSSGIIISGGQK